VQIHSLLYNLINYEFFWGNDMVKKVICILIPCLIIALILGGCGGGKKESAAEDFNKELKETEKEIEKNISDEIGSDVDIDFDMGDIGQIGMNLPLPDSFPKHVVPLVDDANVVNVNEYEENFVVSILYMTKMRYDEVIKFYEEVFKDIEGIYKMQFDGGISIELGKDDYGITIQAYEVDDNNSNVMIDVNYRVLAEREKLKATLASGKSAELPYGYPEDIFPILKGDKVTDSRYSETEDRIYFELYLLSDKLSKDIVAGYEASWSDIKVNYKSISSEDFQLSGDKEDGYEFYIEERTKDDVANIIEYTISITKRK